MTYNFAVSQKAQAAAGLMVYSGVETASPVEAHGALVNNGSSVTAPSLPVSTAGGRLLNLTAANSDGAVTPLSGMAEHFEANSPHPENDKDVLVALADEPVTPGGATGNRTAALTSSGRAIGAALVLRPAGSLPPPPPDTTAPETSIDSGPSGRRHRLRHLHLLRQRTRPDLPLPPQRRSRHRLLITHDLLPLTGSWTA